MPAGEALGVDHPMAVQHGAAIPRSMRLTDKRFRVMP
jgi:hypothetical protein